MTKPNIGLLGANGAGKSTIADYLVEEHGYRKLSFAEPLRELARLSFPWAQMEEILGYQKAKEKAWFRQYLIDLGEGIRKHDPVYFVKALASQITDMDPDKPWVIDDVRKQVEVNFLHDMGFRFVRVVNGDEAMEEAFMPLEGLTIPTGLWPLNNPKGAQPPLNDQYKSTLDYMLMVADWTTGGKPDGTDSTPVLERQGADQDGEAVPPIGDGDRTPHWCARCEREATEHGYPRPGGDAGEGGRGGDEGSGLGDVAEVRDGEGDAVRCHSPRCGGVVLNPSGWPGDVRPHRV